MMASSGGNNLGSSQTGNSLNGELTLQTASVDVKIAQNSIVAHSEFSKQSSEQFA